MMLRPVFLQSSAKAVKPYCASRLVTVGHTPSLLRASSTHFTMATLHPRNLYRRTVNYFNDYPFVKYSLVLCGVVLGGSLVFENFSKHRRKLQPQILSLPPRVGHVTLSRPTELRRVQRAAREARKKGGGTVFLVGPPGSGKTEIVCQYGKQFIEQMHNFTYHFRISKPTVLHLNGSCHDQLHVSLQEAALYLGVKGSEFKDIISLGRAVQEKLAINKVPWLIVVDNLTPSALPTFQSLFHSSGLDWDWRMGHVVVTSRHLLTESGCTVHISDSMAESEALNLLQTLSPSVDFSAGDTSKLSSLLVSSPLALALAASTVNLYATSLEQGPAQEPQPSALAEYLELLGERLSTTTDVTEACLSLYVEAATTQPRVLHTFDLLGALTLEYPVPAGVVDRHLNSPFYRLPPLAPPTTLPPSDPTQDMSYLAQLKMLLPFGNKSPTTPPAESGFDRLYYIRQSPIINFKKYSSDGFELLQVHSMAVKALSSHFLGRTMCLLDQAHVTEAREVFDNTAWFRHYRTFDEQKSLTKYWGSLPGVDGAGVLSRETFKGEQYSNYLHAVSHNHRIICGIISELKLLDDGFAATQFSRYIEPHLIHLCNSEATAESDRVLCHYGLAAVASVVSPHTALGLYQSLLEDQRRVLGQRHPAVARALTDMAGLLFAKEDITSARSLLETALEIYEELPLKSRTAETNIDCGVAMSSLAVVVSCQGERRRSQELLEQALGLYQTVPEAGEVSVYQRRLVATTLTDLGHAYLTLGQLVLAQKHVELAMLAFPTLYPESSAETVRALSVAGAVYAMLGDHRESQRVGQEAGKHRAKLEKQQLVFM